ncbi:hypothetical protein AaE_007842, partial [Aphanomyces astaci]
MARIVCGSGCICRESSNKAPLCRIPLQVTSEQLHVGRLHGFLAPPPATATAEATPTPVLRDWWHNMWNAVTSWFQSPPSERISDSNRPPKRPKTDNGALVNLIPKGKSSSSLMDAVNTTDVPLRHRVFQDLWEKGLYITSGSKFGGDFLIYDADPLTTHAKAIVLVAESPIVCASALAGFCRLARAVKKSWVVAFADGSHGIS